MNNTQSKDVLILFYHKESNACNKLFQIIPKDKKIQYVDINTINNIPPSIKSIPSLVINNTEILSGKKVFDYFSKTDEMEYIGFSSKNNGFSSFSDLNDNSNNVESNSLFSSIDMPSISDGIPKWDENNDSKQTIDMDKLQAERASMFPKIDKQ